MITLIILLTWIFLQLNASLQTLSSARYKLALRMQTCIKNVLLNAAKQR